MCAEWDGKHRHLVCLHRAGVRQGSFGEWVDPMGAHSSLQLCMDYQECCLTTDLANESLWKPRNRQWQAADPISLPLALGDFMQAHIFL